MDDQPIRALSERLACLRDLDKGREEIPNAIDGREKLTQELSCFAL